MPTAVKKKLLHVQLLPLLSGAQNMMLKLLAGINKNEYEIYVICKPGGALIDVLASNGYNYLPVKSLRREISGLDWIAFCHIFLLCKKYRFDIVHTHSSKTGFLGRIAAKAAGVKKIIHTVHGFSFHEFQPKLIRESYVFLERIAAKCCDKMIFVNDFERILAKQRNISDEKKGVTIYNGIEMPVFQKTIHCDGWKKEIIIGSVARFCEQKNSTLMVQTAIQTVKSDKRFRFIFVGDGELFESCKQMVIRAKLQDKILFPGWSSNVQEWLLKFDIFFLFSKWEGLPISILEAMAIGLPVIASDVKGNNELVSEATGALLTISAIDKLPALFFSLSEKCIEWQKKGARAREMIEKKYNIETFRKQYLEIYAS
jgi:glycosyltransferase involved in cell wall biosynthesis